MSGSCRRDDQRRCPLECAVIDGDRRAAISARDRAQARLELADDAAGSAGSALIRTWTAGRLGHLRRGRAIRPGGRDVTAPAEVLYAADGELSAADRRRVVLAGMGHDHAFRRRRRRHPVRPCGGARRIALRRRPGRGPISTAPPPHSAGRPRAAAATRAGGARSVRLRRRPSSIQRRRRLQRAQLTVDPGGHIGPGIRLGWPASSPRRVVDPARADRAILMAADHRSSVLIRSCRPGQPLGLEEAFAVIREEIQIGRRTTARVTCAR